MTPRQITGVEDDRKINAFTDEEFNKLWQGIETIEGYKVGAVVQAHKVTHTRQDKKSCISDYYVDPIGWLIKEKCIFLARQNQLELEICTSRLGHSYLKAPHSSFQINLKSFIEKKPRK